MALAMGKYRAMVAQNKHPKGTWTTSATPGSAYNRTIFTDLKPMAKQAVRRHLKKWGNPKRTELGISTVAQTAQIDAVCSLLP